MKKILINLMLLILFFVAISNKPFKNDQSGIKWPPYSAMIKCPGSFYIDQTEVTVDSWISYYYWMLVNEGTEKAGELLPDSSAVSENVWTYINSVKPVQKNSLFQKYGTHTGQPMPVVLKECPDLISNDAFLRNNKTKKCPYGMQPITGLSYQQVLDFCRWKTKMMGCDTIEYRLPTPEEWRKIVRSGFGQKTENMTDSTCKGERPQCAAFNYRLSETSDEYGYWGRDGQSLKPVGMFLPNEFAVYDLFGNASEMTLAEGISLGGNYTLFASQCHTDSVQPYSKPEKWLGFRCIVKIN